MEYAIIQTGGKQYKVEKGALLDVEKLEGEAGKEVRLEAVLAVRKASGLQIGRPNLDGVSVKAEIVTQTKGPKVINFKFKRRKGYHRKVGHRQKYTRLKIVEIS